MAVVSGYSVACIAIARTVRNTAASSMRIQQQLGTPNLAVKRSKNASVMQSKRVGSLRTATQNDMRRATKLHGDPTNDQIHRRT